MKRDTLSIRVERMSGGLWLRCGEHEVEDESITVPLRKGDDER